MSKHRHAKPVVHLEPVPGTDASGLAPSVPIATLPPDAVVSYVAPPVVAAQARGDACVVRQPRDFAARVRMPRTA